MRRPTRAPALLAASLLLASGCSRAPKPTAVVPADTSRTRVVAPVAPPDTAKVAVRKPDGPATTPAPRPGRNAPTSFPGTTTGSSTSAPAVVPKVTAEEQDKLEKETLAAVELAQKALDAIDSTKLDPDRNRKYVIAKDFLAQAGEARTRHEFERAQGLAVKAKLLAEELVAK